MCTKIKSQKRFEFYHIFMKTTIIMKEKKNDKQDTIIANLNKKLIAKKLNEGLIYAKKNLPQIYNRIPITFKIFRKTTNNILSW